jgi:AraC-like DNA-binding protein
MITICTVLSPGERSRVEAAGDGCFSAVHAESVPEALEAARRRPVDAFLVSAHRCATEDLGVVARAVREFPAIPTVAIVSRHDPKTTETLLRLGATGVRAVVDVTDAAGWRRLRQVVGQPASPVVAEILAALLPHLDEAPPDCRLFFDALARLAPVMVTVRSLARHLKMVPSTLMSRFYRAGVPSPKNYLAGMRLAHAAYLLETPGLSVADVAYRLDYSSPQSFGRHLKAMLAVTAAEFRRRFPFTACLSRYLDVLVIPYRERLSRLHPLDARLWDCGPDGRRSRAG